VALPHQSQMDLSSRLVALVIAAFGIP